MKLLFIVRSTLFTAKGGDTIQVEETAIQLRKMGVEVDIKKANERMSYTSYDLLHFFNIIRPADILVHIKRSGKPFVVSTILVDYSAYDKRERPGMAGKLSRLLPAGSIEYFKTLYRWLLGGDSLVSTSYLWKGHRRSIREILQKTRSVFVQAAEEYNELVSRYNVRPPFSIIQNGVNTALFKEGSSGNKENRLVICVARIEGIKNQYNLIKALSNTKYKLLLIGDAAPNQKNYYERCRKLAGKNVSFINHLPQHELVSYYAKAKVHVLPSWFEVCGLSSLEAAAMGCRVVISDRGYTRSYFHDTGFYCDPAQPDTILEAVEEAMASGMNDELQHYVTQNYTWQKAAEKIFSVYKKYTEQCSH